MTRRKWYSCLLLAFFSANSPAEQVIVAVAANFNAAMNRLIPAFSEVTGYQAVAGFGSTGKLYAQITQGAPYQVFLSADNSRTRLTVEAGVAVPGTEIVYAIGRLALWSANEELVNDSADILTSGSVRKIALANPKTAPYGTAAQATLISLGLYDQLAGKLVQAESVAQAFQFTATGNANVGFVALSQLKSGSRGGSFWLVADDLYPPLLQEAVLLNRGKDSGAAKAFMTFLNSAVAKAIIAEMGYKLPGG